MNTIKIHYDADDYTTVSVREIAQEIMFHKRNNPNHRIYDDLKAHWAINFLTEIEGVYFDKNADKYKFSKEVAHVIE